MRGAIPAPGPGERDTIVDGVRWRSREVEGEGEPLIFLHGLLASSASWQGVLSACGGRRPALALDLPGFGSSDRPWPYDYSVAGQARSLLRFMDARGIRRAVLIGNSLGGALALFVAAEHPDRVSALVLVDPATPQARIPWTVRVMRAPLAGEASLAFAFRPFVAVWLKRGLYAQASRVTDREIDDAWRPLKIRGTRRAALAAIRTDPSAYRGLEGRVRVPTLILWGERDRLLSPRDAENVRSRIPGARLVLVPDAGHLPQRERPEAFAAAVAGFLGRLPVEGFG